MRKTSLFAVAAVLAMVLAACSVFCPREMADNFTVHKVYGDHMVLQRQKPVKISGTAEAGKSVKVTLADKSVYAEADQNGEWVAIFAPMEAGGPYVVTVNGGAKAEKVEFNDVLLGEVWVCSGQSNMEWSVKNSKNGAAEVASSANNQIRLYNVNSRRGVSPRKVVRDVDVKWQLCGPDTVGNFSAIGYFFGREINKELKVPVGLINSSWGGTPIESWISLEGYQKYNWEKALNRIAALGAEDPAAKEKLKNAAAEAVAKMKIWEEKFYGDNAAAVKAAEGWKDADINLAGWEKVKAPGSIPEDMIGVYWFRSEFTAPDSWADKDLILSLGAIDDCDVAYINGVKVGSTMTDTPMYWSAPRIYQVPASLVKPGKNVIAVRVVNNYGGGGMSGPGDQMFVQLKADKNQKVMLAGDNWYGKKEFAVASNFPVRPEPAATSADGDRPQNFPATLYNAMIAPLTCYPVRGFLWYQGESNAGAYRDYMTLQPMLIDNWRTLWGDDSMPFIFVQLAAYQAHRPKDRLPDDFWKNRQPGNDSWAYFREVQTATLKVPNTGMAVTIDVGDHSDIHPIDKQTVGYRMAKEAGRICYGSKDISAGPMYDKQVLENGKIRIFFTNVGGGLVADPDGTVNTFAIRGEKGDFVWAKAKVEGDTVVVWADEVKDPKFVRYSWSSYPGNPNLFNKEGFPASPFRSEEADYLLK